MTVMEAMSERAIILAPLGRDSQIALMMLNEAGYDGVIARDMASLCAELENGAGLLLIASEALLGSDIEPLFGLIEQQQIGVPGEPGRLQAWYPREPAAGAHL